MANKSDELDATKRLMGSLVRMKPKPHEEMKISKPRKARPAKAKKRKVSKKA